jgi:hypothetical protein
MQITKNDGVLERVRDKAPVVGDGVSSPPGKEFLLPGVLGLAGAVAAKKAPGLVRGVTGSLAKGTRSLLDQVADDGGTKKTRRLPIQRWTTSRWRSTRPTRRGRASTSSRTSCTVS